MYVYSLLVRLDTYIGSMVLGSIYFSSLMKAEKDEVICLHLNKWVYVMLAKHANDFLKNYRVLVTNNFVIYAMLMLTNLKDDVSESKPILLVIFVIYVCMYVFMKWDEYQIAIWVCSFSMFCKWTKVETTSCILFYFQKQANRGLKMWDYPHVV